jgi:hypothetical protein
MNNMKTHDIKTGMVLAATCLVIASFVLAPAIAHALVSFKGMGIDPKTMQVEDPSILKAYGMKDVKAGDGITISKDADGKVYFLNNRTGERLKPGPTASQTSVAPAAGPTRQSR